MNKTEMLVYILFSTDYQIKTVTGKRRYNISCQTLEYSSQVNKQSQAVLSSPVKPHLERRLSSNKHLLQMYGFSKTALTEQTNIRFKSRKGYAWIV